MTVTGVTDCAILAILRHRLHRNYTSITPSRLPGPGVIACASIYACGYICPLGLLGTPLSLLLRRRRGSSLRPVWALISGYSLSDLPLVRARGGDGSGSCCRGGRVCLCKQLIHRH